MYCHFVKEGEQERKERDSKQEIQVIRGFDKKTIQMYVPMFVDTVENMKKVEELWGFVEEYIQIALYAQNPVYCICLRKKRTDCGCCFKSLFGEPEQMGNVLAQTFEGQHRWITHAGRKDKTHIDAMFFTNTGEKIDDSNDSLYYKENPTFILCNPNAMFYQHMMNFPHAFYLRFFISKGINVLIWNYRGYSRSHTSNCLTNSPSPTNIKEDAECVLTYLKNVMGLKGKFGVYGRSMGGIATCHLAKHVDMIIVDRTFATLNEVID